MKLVIDVPDALVRAIMKKAKEVAKETKNELNPKKEVELVEETVRAILDFERNTFHQDADRFTEWLQNDKEAENEFGEIVERYVYPLAKR